MNGVTELLILELLSRREMYGYELVSSICASSGAVIQVSEGGVYPLLHSMEDAGFLASRRVERDGRSRLYYRLTNAGRGRLGRTKEQWVRLTGAIQAVLGANDAKPA